MSKSPEEIVFELAQECISKAPVIILGSGASAAHGIPGMPDLRDQLLSTPAPDAAAPDDLIAWTKFLSQLNTTDLETALTLVQLTNGLTRHIVERTWDFLAPFDLRAFENVICKRDEFPLTRLYQHLFKSTHTEINVVTPNYDRLAEYAADAGELCHFTGFGYGHLRLRARDIVPRVVYGKTPARTVNVWKVHGSFDWFRDIDGVVMALPINGTRPIGFDPVIVTPGIEKYRLTHDEPFLSIKQGADTALQSARSYLCIGYGFNDSHVQTKLVEQCRIEPVPLVLITKEITTTARDFLRSGKCQRYLALEECATGCRMFSSDYPDGAEIDNKHFWRLDEFLKMVI